MHLPHLLVAASTTLGLAHAGSLIQPRANDVFEVTKPAPGDTVAVTEEEYGQATIDIEWTVSEAIRDRPMMLILAQGDDVEAMTEIEVITSDAENNGRYSWTAYLDLITTSGCNYTIYAKCWTSTAYSGYFAIMSAFDGGLDPSSTCPVDEGILRPSNGSYVEPTNTAQEDVSGSTASSDSSTNGGTNEQASTTGGEQTGSSSSDNNGGVSTTTLAVAVAVPIVVLLAIFAAVLVIGRRRGWFVRKQDRMEPLRDRGPVATASTGDVKAGAEVFPHVQEQDEKTSNVRVGELHGHDRPHQSDGAAIYQLYGDEQRRA